MNYQSFVLRVMISAVWLINGLFCKVLNFVPRHEQIVSEILGLDQARVLILLIGFAEVGLAIWFLTSYKPILNTVVQIVVVLTMNILEFVLVPHLLLWESYNIVFAFFFLGLVYYNTTLLNKNTYNNNSV